MLHISGHENIYIERKNAKKCRKKQIRYTAAIDADVDIRHVIVYGITSSRVNLYQTVSCKQNGRICQPSIHTR